MTFKHKLGAASVLAAAWYAAGAAAADYNTQIYSVAVDGDSGMLLIDGVDLAPAGAPAGAHVQLLGQTLTIQETGSSSTHLEAALPESVSLNPGIGYQLYVSPSRSRTSAAASPADQAFFTIYVTSKVDGARTTTVVAGSGSGASNSAAAASAAGAKKSSTNFFNSLGSAFSINPHSSVTSPGGPTTNDGSTFTLPYTGSLSSATPLFTLTNTGAGDALDGISPSTAANAVAIRGVMSSTSAGSLSAAVRGINNGTGSNGIGVYGSHAGTGWGVFGTTVSGIGVRGLATGNGIGFFATSSGSGMGLYASSNGGISGMFSTVNSANASDDVSVSNAGTGRGIFLNNTNASTTANGLEVDTAGKGRGIFVNATNTSSAATALQVSTAGTGSVASFNATNSPSTSVVVTNPGTGMGLSSSSTGGTGLYGVTGTLSGAGVLGDNFNGGEAVTGRTTSAKGVATGAVVGRNDGPGYGVSGFVATDTSGNGIGVLGRVGISGSTGVAGRFENVNSANTANALYVATNGPGVIADHSQGNAGSFFANNTSGVGAGVRGEVNSIFGNNGTAGVYGVASGTGGYGGYFEHSNASGFGQALYATTAGGGIVAQFLTQSGAGGTGSSSNSQATVSIQQNANGEGLDIAVTSPTASGDNPNTANAVNVTSNGPGVIADHSQGNAGNFFMNNTSGVGAGVRGEVNSIFGNNGTAGVYGVASGTGGYAGYFEHTESSGFGITVQLVSNDQGTGLVVDKENANGDPAIFQHTGSNVARIDNTGRGFFNGGTQNSGADLAEFVPVSGSMPQVGDVVEIDPAHPDTFRLCSRANTTQVAGIISTAPGVTLNAKDGATQAVSGPALALAGRVPTKVNDRGGKIHIGDLLVASAEPGRAMRAPAHPRPGTVIGKALQDSDAAESTVEVLVMLR